jgi:MFS transporter, YQGE family, putative transporter
MPTKSKHRIPARWIGVPKRLFGGDPLHHSVAPTSRESDSSGSKASGRLTRQAVLLLSVNGLFAVANALSGLFVHVYLWKMKQNFALIGWFALVQQLTMALTFWIAGKWVKERNKMVVLRLGVAINALFYLVILWLSEQAVYYIILLGVIQGLASGMFWLAFNVVYFEVTDPDNRDRFNGWAGLLGSGAGMLAPWLSGFLITRMTDSSGYRLIFSISLVVFIIGVVVSFFLKKREAQNQYDWAHTIRKLKSSSGSWRKVFAALVAQGIREGVFGFIIGLLVYISTQSEANLGNFSLVTSAVGFFSFWLVGRWLKPHYRKWGMLAGVLAITSVIVPFFWAVDYRTLLIFGIGVGLFMPLYTVPMTSAVFDLIGKDRESAEQRVEFIVLRELGLNAGRMLGTLIFLGVISISASPMVLNVLILVIGSSPILVWILMRNNVSSRFSRPADG